MQPTCCSLRLPDAAAGVLFATAGPTGPSDFCFPPHSPTPILTCREKVKLQHDDVLFRFYFRLTTNRHGQRGPSSIKERHHRALKSATESHSGPTDSSVAKVSLSHIYSKEWIEGGGRRSGKQYGQARRGLAELSCVVRPPPGREGLRGKPTHDHPLRAAYVSDVRLIEIDFSCPLQ